MPQIEIDLRTRVLPPGHQVYVARPGQQYRLYPAFIEESVVGPELPGLQLPSGPPVESDPFIIAKINRSLAVRSWYRRGRPGDPPSRNLEDYNNNPTLRSSQVLAIVKGYFDKAKRGDMAVVPPQAYSRDVYVGEFVDGPNKITTFRAPALYGRYSLPGRRVRWLTSFPKRKLPLNIMATLDTPNAFFQTPQRDKGFFYDEAYPNYSLSDEYRSEFKVTSHDFTPEDDIRIQAFFNFVAANVRSADTGADYVLGIREAIFERLGDYSPDLSTNINSPGVLALKSVYLTPLVAAALLALALKVEPSAAIEAAESGTIVFGNSASSEECSLELDVQQQVVQQLKMLGLDKWPEACEKAREAAENVGLQSPAGIKQHGP